MAATCAPPVGGLDSLPAWARHITTRLCRFAMTATSSPLYNTPKYEDDPDRTIMTLRLRYGAEDWDMPEPWPDFPDADDTAPVFWNEGGKLWLFFGSPRLLGGPP